VSEPVDRSPLKLVIDDAVQFAALANRVGPDQEVWRDDDGVVFAYGNRANGAYSLAVPGVGVFRFGGDEGGIRVVPEPSASRAGIDEAYRRLVLPNALQALGKEVLHGSAVLAPHGVAALCARSRTGKSTLAFALSRRGYAVWADDAVAFEVVGRSVRALPLPFRIQLRPASAAFFGRDTPVELPQGVANGPTPLVAIFLLERAAIDQPECELRRLPPPQAFMALLGNAYWFTLADQERKRRMVSEYLDLSDLVPIFSLRFPLGFERLDAVVAAVEHVLREGAEGE
jgi:hypothetical protein